MTPVQDQTQSELYAAILDRIISGEFPPGHRLVEERLAEQFSVSRTPVREVLFALQKDGLVERSPHRSARVVSFSADDVEELYNLRKLLECHSVANAIRTLKLNQLMDLERRLDDLIRDDGRGGPAWNQKQAEIDLELHRLLVSHSANRRLMAYLDNISILIHSLRLIGRRDDRQARQADEEHLGIVRALLRRDEELATRLLAEHIDNSKNHMLGLLFGRDHAGEPHAA